MPKPVASLVQRRRMAGSWQKWLPYRLPFHPRHTKRYFALGKRTAPLALTASWLISIWLSRSVSTKSSLLPLMSNGRQLARACLAPCHCGHAWASLPSGLCANPSAISPEL